MIVAARPALASARRIANAPCATAAKDPAKIALSSPEKQCAPALAGAHFYVDDRLQSDLLKLTPTAGKSHGSPLLHAPGSAAGIPNSFAGKKSWRPMCISDF